MANIAIILANQFKKAYLKFDDNTFWCYVGKDINVREKISTTLNHKHRFFLKDRLYKIMEQLRQPFVDLIAELGGLQRDQLNWWASRFASRSPFQTDFSLFLCYKVLIEGIIKEQRRDRKNIYIFVDDHWLFQDIKENYKNTDIQFMGKPFLLREKLILFQRGIISRIFILSWFFLKYFLISYYNRNNKLKTKIFEERSVGILSYAEERAFVNNSYVDPYMCELAGLLEKQDMDVIHAVHFRIPLSIIKKIGKVKNFLWPLILDLRPHEMLLSVIQWWRPSISKNIKDNLSVNGYSVINLIKREKWEEFSMTTFNFNIIFYYAMLRFLKKGWCHSLVYTYENQPWEKMLCIAAKRIANVKVIGYQHSSIPSFLLSQYLGKGEDIYMPLPDRILTTGEYLWKFFRDNGIPVAKLRIGGAWRYKYLWEGKHDYKQEILNSHLPKKQVVLVALPVDVVNAQALLYLISHQFPDGGNKDNVEFWIKPHPDVPLSKIKIEHNKLKNFKVVSESVNKLFDKVKTIIYSSCSVGLEAILYGDKKIIRYIPENLIDMDRIDWIKQDIIFTIYDGDDIKEILAEETATVNSDDLYSLRNSYFAKIKPEVWLEEVNSF